MRGVTLRQGATARGISKEAGPRSGKKLAIMTAGESHWLPRPPKSSLSNRCMRSASGKLPEGPDWLYEIKLDGYRCLAGKDAGGVRLWSRRGNALTLQFSAIAKGQKGSSPLLAFC